jgi:tetratricopeptide (TPR) repeat protein
VSLQALDRHDEAIPHCARAIALSPNYAEAHNNLGNALMECGRSGEALTHYERSAAIRPNLAEAHNNIGVSLHALNQEAEAIAHFDKALILRPDYAEAYANIGIALESLGRINEATQAFEKAIELAPTIAKFYRCLFGCKKAVAGDRQLLAMIDLAQQVKSGLSDAEKRAYALADNKIAANADWDRLDITGFEESEIQALFGRTDPRDKTATPKTKHPASKRTTTVSRIGDLWELGPDIILCRDSLLAEDIPRIAGARDAVLIVFAKRPQSSAHSEGGSPVLRCFYEAASEEFAELVCNVLSNEVRDAVSDAFLFVIMESLWRQKPIGTGAVLAPRVADIAIRQWQARTNRDAILASTGQSFDGIASTRRKIGGAP